MNEPIILNNFGANDFRNFPAKDCALKHVHIACCVVQHINKAIAAGV